MSAFEQSSSSQVPQGTGQEAVPQNHAAVKYGSLAKIDEEMRAEIRLLVKAEVGREIACFKASMGQYERGGRLPATDSSSRRLTIKEMVPLMPPGLRSESSIRRCLTDRSIPGRKLRGRWSLDPAEVKSAFEGRSARREAVEEFPSVWMQHERESRKNSKWPHFPGRRSKQP
jgi:hypothetical protein